ncbi:MAG: hypothetical protein ACE5GF_05885 [Thermodesulfobacteriota bacterium]
MCPSARAGMRFIQGPICPLCGIPLSSPVLPGSA